LIQNAGFNQYVYLLIVLAGAVAVAAVLAGLLSRARPRDPAPDHRDPGSAGLLPAFMMLLTGLAVGAGLLLLIPAGMIIRYFPHWQVAALLCGAVVLLALPLAYAWRTRPF
jgi:hypothetical protein